MAKAANRAPRHVRVRLLLDTGASVDDPSVEQLDEALARVEGGADEFVIVEKPTRRGDAPYAQTVRDDDGTWRFEVRDGGPQTHVRVQLADRAAVLEAFGRWIEYRPGWERACCFERVEL